MEFWNNIQIEIWGALITGVFVLLTQKIRFCWILRRNFHNAHFDVYYKGDRTKKIRTVILTIKGHTIHYTGEHIPKASRESTFEGEFIMNVINLKIGSGIHYHKNYEGFNFPKAFIANRNTIYIETAYLSNEKSEDKSKFV